LKTAAIGIFKDSKAASESEQAKAAANAVGKGFEAGVQKVGDSKLSK